MDLHGLRKKKEFQFGDRVFVPHANTNFCLAEIIQANASAHLVVNGSNVPVKVSKVHFLGWTYKEDMYVLQSELFEVTKQAFETKVRMAQTFKQPITGAEIKSLKNTYELHKFGDSKCCLEIHCTLK